MRSFLIEIYAFFRFIIARDFYVVNKFSFFSPFLRPAIRRGFSLLKDSLDVELIKLFMESLNFLRKYRNDSFEPHKHWSWNRDKTVFNWITLPRVSELEIMKCSTPIRLQQPPRSPSAEQQSTKWKRNDITLSWRLLEKWNLFLINFMIFRCVVKAYVLGRRRRWRSVGSGERWLKETGKAVVGKWYSLKCGNSSFHVFMRLPLPFALPTPIVCGYFHVLEN